MINLQWLELPVSWTNFHGPKDVRAFEVRLYAENFTIKNENFQIKNSDIFHISAQHIDCGYSLESPRWDGSTSTHNLCFEQK